MANTTYLAITIGPITKTLLQARKTKELWAASYTFAYLMKKIAEKVYTQDQKDNYTARKWLKPALGEVALDNMKEVKNRASKYKNINGVGIFPDNLIFSLREPAEEKTVRDAIFKVVEEFGDKISAKLNLPAKDVRDYVRNYYQIYWVLKEVDEQLVNPIQAMSELLNSVELQKAFEPVKRSYLYDFFKTVDRSFLYGDAFGTDSSQRFESIPEIALKAFKDNLKPVKWGAQVLTCWPFVKEQRKSNSDPDDDKYIEWVNDFRRLYAEQNPDEPLIPFLSGHKYMAIVLADGDGVGKLLAKLKPEQLGAFSTGLTDFAVKAAEMVKNFGGLPVYFGGDDALFFAPVIAGDGPEKNVFSLLRNLDQLFRDGFNEFETEVEKPTLTFGVSIAYYKFPLYESLNQSLRLLHFIGKKGGLKSDEIDPRTKTPLTIKNNIVFRLLKHSGSNFNGIIHLNAEEEYSVLDDFISLLAMGIHAPSQALRSIIYRIPQNKTLLAEIAKDRTALQNWVENSFDEAPHQDRAAYIQEVTDLIYKVYTHHYRYPAELDEDSFAHPDRVVYSLLKTIAFLTTNEA